MAQCMVLDGEYAKSVITALINQVLQDFPGPIEIEIEVNDGAVNLRYKIKNEAWAELLKKEGVVLGGRVESLGQDMKSIGDILDRDGKKKWGSKLEKTGQEIQKQLKKWGPKLEKAFDKFSRGKAALQGAAAIVKGACESSKKCEEKCLEKLKEK